MKDKVILIIDDMAFDRTLLSKALSKKIQCTTLEVSSGQEALDLLSTQTFDMILLDVEMPVMSGEEVLLKIRQKSRQEELPVIMISGRSQDSIVVNCLKSGANDFISKPINFEIAITRIINHLRLTEAIKDLAKLQEMAALNAMVTTYNHEINTPLTIAFAGIRGLQKNRNDDPSFNRVNDGLNRIAEIVKKIATVSEKREAEYEVYSGTSKMLKLR